MRLNRPSCRVAALAAVTAAAAVVAPAADAATITNRATVAGGLGVTNAFDPGPSPASPNNTSQDKDSEAATSTGQARTAESLLEARTDLRVIQDWSGLDNGANSATGPVNTFSYADPNFPDVRTTVAGNFQTDGINGPSTNYILATSPGSGYRFANSGNNSMTVTIDFGDFTGSTFTSAVNAVDAAGFLVANLNGGQSLSVDFLDDAGNLLSRQTAPGADSDVANSNDSNTSNDGTDVYFGLDSADGNIGSIVITRTATSNGTTGSGLDDLGFTLVPEPGSAGALAAVGLLALARRRRRALTSS